MATTATFDATTGLLNILGDAANNTTAISRNGAGNILVNGGAIPVQGGPATVADTEVIQAFGADGNDRINASKLAEAAIQLVLDGGAGNDTITGSGAVDELFGKDGNDVLMGGAGNDKLFGGNGDDTLIGGDGDDQVFGEAGNDRMIWNPGDDTDLFEGGDGIDTAEVNGGNGAEVFTATANGTRVRFDRLDPAPFAIDIGTSEKLVLNAGGGDDTFSATGNLAALIEITVDGGAGNDTLLGGNGKDVLLGGDGNDFIDGQQGNDTALLGAGNDVFQWDPGDGSDLVEGQGGTDTMLFNGSAGDEIFAASANGGRAIFTRNLGNIVMDLNDVETIQLNALGGADVATVNDLTGTDVRLVAIDLAGTIGGTAGDGKVDSVIVNGTNGGNNISVALAGAAVSVTGLSAKVTIDHAESTDTLTINALGGNDKIDASKLTDGAIGLVVDGGAGNDTINGGQGSDTILGGDGNDSVFGDDGNDVALLGAGDDRFRWAPGDDNDVVEGQDGIDTLVFDGANVSENIDIVANGGRALFTRNVANVVMDLNDVERIEFNALGGEDNIIVGDLSGTDVKVVEVDLAAVLNGKGGDGKLDSVTVNATNGVDVVSIASAGGKITVEGLAADVILDHADKTDRLVINGLGGNDVIDATALAGGKIALQVNGGLGEDVILGSAGNDTVNGGDGNDVAILGGGNDVFIWNPGDDNDVVEGRAGIDTMLFNGAAGAEIVDISADGGRVNFFRDVANVIMDLNDVETVEFNALGGADKINVGDLSGTDAKLIDIDLAAALGGTAGDGEPDSVIVNGSNGNNSIAVTLAGTAVSVTGLSAKVTVDHADAGDTLTVNGHGGNDAIDASKLSGGKIQLVLDGGAGNDTLTGSAGDDTIKGGAGDDRINVGAGNDSVLYTSALDGRDIINGFDGDAAGGQDLLDLDALFDGLGVAEADRAGRVSVDDKGGSVNIAVDADGNAGNGFELVVATLNTNDAINVGQDVLVGA
jgi:Ca2+-binding RTX toxin-like protein